VAFFNRRKCRTCTRFVSPRDLIAGVCGICWKERAQPGGAAAAIAPFFTGEVLKCMECGAVIRGHGYMHWVKDAGQFAVFCIPCSERKFQTDEQHRNTEFAFRNKIQ